MVKIIYNGDVSPCRIKINNVTIKKWSTGEIKNLGVVEAEKLLKDNKNFSNVGEMKVKKPVEIKEKEEFNLDLNNDGVIDRKDKSIAGKVLSYKNKKISGGD